MVKLCKRCEETKPCTEFNKSASNKDGYKSICRLCQKKQHDDYRNSEEGIAKRKEYSESKRGRERANAAAIKYKYSIEEQQYRHMIDNGCDMCGSKNNLCIDHDHNCCPGKKTCGQCIRGVLCQGCNKGIGNFNDDIDRLQAAINYLRKYNV